MCDILPPSSEIEERTCSPEELHGFDWGRLNDRISVGRSKQRPGTCTHCHWIVQPNCRFRSQSSRVVGHVYRRHVVTEAREVGGSFPMAPRVLALTRGWPYNPVPSDSHIGIGNPVSRELGRSSRTRFEICRATRREARVASGPCALQSVPTQLSPCALSIQLAVVQQQHVSRRHSRIADKVWYGCEPSEPEANGSAPTEPIEAYLVDGLRYSTTLQGTLRQSQSVGPGLSAPRKLRFRLSVVISIGSERAPTDGWHPAIGPGRARPFLAGTSSGEQPF